MTDVFEEVEEQLRTDRYKTLALRALPWVLGGLALILALGLGLWGWNAWQSRAMGDASQAYAEGVEAFGAGDMNKAEQRFAEVAENGPDGYAALALMQQAGLKVNDGDVDAAVKLFDEAAAKAPDPILGDAARLKSAFAVLDTAPLSELKTRLEPLTEDGRPYRALALEALAFAKLMGGEMDEARADFGVLALMPGVSEMARQRAQAARAMIDSGTAKALPDAVKASLALPPPASDDAASAEAPLQQGSTAQ
ncbi:tetratricopeptide repeat protein [Phenylobacterium sp.]|uniref:tetratricopeptide repeat protein n=1 Tax=Phenylobacterium sp. TaxID=1871053 RepID=UPI00272FAFB2|nr:tetratricopeptide repeat protein [Phenylobacterium sp.]MDP1874659.1 tetratricopeptide repeat protein [Phenylobacterium sp.]MDP3491400.1 tetratricopeptide repeat protein [Phenylobacterium sp.]